MNIYEKIIETDLKELLSRPMGRRLLLANMGLLMASCASGGKKTRYREGDNKGQKALSVDEERRMTKEYLPQMRKEYPSHPNPELQKYMQNLGQNIVQANRLANNPYQYNFTVVDHKMVNAFALPAGEVFVTTGLMNMADNEAELAGVVGHEIGHIKARHTAERMAQAREQQTNTLLYTLGGAVGGLILGEGLSKLICKKDRECINRIRKYGAYAGAAGGLLIQKFAFMANSREDEMEADRIGFRTCINAGYDKVQSGAFYSKLYEMEQKHKGQNNALLASISDSLSTHPPGKERVQQMRELATKTPQPKKAIVNTKAFDKIKRLIS